MNRKTKELNRLNNSLDKQISPANQQVFTDLICYLRGGNISEYYQEVVRQDLTEMVLSAQQRGENIQSVIGGNYQEFCDNIIASLPAKTTKQKVMDFFNIVCGALFFLGVINIIMADETIAMIRSLVAGQPVNYYISVSTGSAISIGIIIVAAIIIVEFIMKNSFLLSKKKQHNRLKTFLTGAGLGVGVMAVFLIIMQLGKATLFTVNIFVACASVLALYLAHRILSQLT